MFFIWYKEEMRKRNNTIEWIVIALLLFALLNLFTGFSDNLRFSLVSFFSPAQERLMNRGSFLFGNLEVVRNIEKVSSEIESLRKENTRLNAEIAKIKEIEKENRALKRALNINLLIENDFVYARVVSRDFTGHQINVYHEEKVKIGSLVVNKEGALVGKVVKSKDSYSKIDLITSENTAFQARIQNKDAPVGVLRGKGEKLLEIDLIAKNKDINRGDVVVSLPKESSPDGGIYIGKILEIKESDVDAFIKASVWHGLDYRYLDYLFIIAQ
jgi:rod shape-determining protein MreC